MQILKKHHADCIMRMRKSYVTYKSAMAVGIDAATTDHPYSRILSSTMLAAQGISHNDPIPIIKGSDSP